MSVIEKAVGKNRDKAAPSEPAVALAHDSAEASMSCSGADGQSHTVALRQLGIEAGENDALRLAKEFRRIKRPLLDNAFGREATIVRDGRLMMVTSALPSEGKTFTVANLAVSIAAEQDIRVLMIDGDAAKADLSRAFGVGRSEGIVDVLLGKSRLQDAIIDTETTGLRLLPAGSYHPNTTELFSCQRMREQLRSLLNADSRLVVVLDSPPLIATTESQALAALVGQVVCVVKAETTTKRALKESIALLDMEKPIGMILNGRMREAGMDDPYGYYRYDRDRM